MASIQSAGKSKNPKIEREAYTKEVSLYQIQEWRKIVKDFLNRGMKERK